MLSIPLAPEWTARAACRYADPEMFFGEQGTTFKVAKKLCAPCVVKNQCLLLALEIEGGTSRQSRYGVFGGLTPDERANLSRRSA
jgi:WhiB family redox-sensing transcriptional regulator